MYEDGYYRKNLVSEVSRKTQLVEWSKTGGLKYICNQAMDVEMKDIGPLGNVKGRSFQVSRF